MRAEQRWVGLAWGMASRAARFLSGLLISTACLRAFGVQTWGVVAVSLAAADLVSFVDFALPELCAYQAAHADTRAQLKARLGQALCLFVLPAIVGVLLLLGAAWTADGWSRDAGELLEVLLLASACGYPFALLANCYGATLQGLGRLREMNAMHALSGVLELCLVLVLLALEWDAVQLQWARAASQVLRLVCFAAPFGWLSIELPRPGKPQRAQLKPMVEYCIGNSSTRALGGALWRIHVPVAQAFTTRAVLGSYDVVDRLGSVLQRAANPVWDSLFQRLVRSFGANTPAAHEAGRRDFVAGALILSGISAGATVFTVNLAPLLFPIWLGGELARAPIAYAPWVMLTWSLNLSTGMCAAVLAARARFRASGIVHALALAATIVSIVVLGRQDGELGMLAGPAIGNATLAVGLSWTACRSVQLAWPTYLMTVFGLWIPALLALLCARLWPMASLPATVLGGLGVMLLVARAEPVRSLARDFQNPALARS